MQYVKNLSISLLAVTLFSIADTSSAVVELIITAPPDLTVSCNQSYDPPNTGIATAEGGCDPENHDIVYLDAVTPGVCSSNFTIERTWTVMDNCGETASATQIVTVVDTTPPSAPPPPSGLSLQCTADIPPPAQLTATDNCSGDITVFPSAVITPGDCNNQFNMQRTWTFADQCGNQASVSQSITIDDTTPPSAPSPPASLNLECAADTPPPVNLTANDNCSGDITVSPSAVITPGVCEDQFQMQRTWTFSDQCGNQASVSQSIAIDDTTPPSAPSPPASLNLECAADTPPPVNLTANDNCSGDITVSPSAVITPGVCNNQFNMQRTWTFSDRCGNQASVGQSISIDDQEAPVITCPPDGSVESATATDNCTAPVNPLFTDYPDGTRTWEAADECANSSSCSIVLCEADPMSAGYWNRQCLGVAAADGGLDPGRKGKGPKAPTEPDFEELLMECADLELADLGIFNETTCSGIEGKPASDDCERATRQLTALILNLCSDRLQSACPVCIDSCEPEDTTDNVASVINEIAADINSGFCKQAAEKAVLINEGEGICVFED